MTKTGLVLDALVFIPIFLLLFRVKPVSPFSSFYSEGITKEASCAIKGLLAVCVVFHHITPCISNGHLIRFFYNVGSPCVAMFFFLSSYGIMKQHIQSEKYCRKFLLKRLPLVLIPFSIALTLYLCIEHSIGAYLSVIQCLKWAFLAGRPDIFMPFSWFFVALIPFYIAFKILMIVFRRHYNLMLLGGIAYYILYLWYCFKWNFGDYWYATAFALPLGMIWAVYEKKGLQILKKCYIPAGLLLVITFLTVIFLHKEAESSEYEIIRRSSISFLFICLVIMILMKINFNNKMLESLGKISLEIYLCQGFFIKYLRSDIVAKYHYIQNDFVWTALVLVLTLLTSVVLYYICDVLLKGYLKLINKQN